MDDAQRRAALGTFLRARREALSPTEIGLPAGARRRTTGLRREEVALTADISTTWYTYLEQGRAIRASWSVLESIADALRLTRDERQHLAVLAGQAALGGLPAPEEALPPVYQRVLDGWEDTPAYITGRRTDIVAWNRAATAVFGDFARVSPPERNLLWLLFTDGAFRRLFVDAESVARETMAAFRATAAPHMDDPGMAGFIDALGRESPAFRWAWARQQVRGTCAGRFELAHPTAGRLVLDLAGFQVSGDLDIKCCVYAPTPGTRTEDALRNLLRGAGVPPPIAIRSGKRSDKTAGLTW